MASACIGWASRISFILVTSADVDTPSLRPVGVFDSGLGGLTAVRELRQVLPAENVAYLGDSARVPYGIKSLATVRQFARQDAAFLLRMAPKLLLVACNTASAAAVDLLEETSPVPVVDVIRPGAKAAVETVQNSDAPIGVIATEATVASGAYQRALAELVPGRRVVAVACPLLVPIVEEGRPQDDPIVLHVLCDYLHELQRARVGVLILGCTHYPLLVRAIGKLMGPDVPLVSSGRAAALAVADRLAEMNLAAPGTSPGRLDCYTTDNPERFDRLAERFGGRKPDSVTFVGTDELEGPAPSPASLPGAADVAPAPAGENV